MRENPINPETDELILIVTGAHLRSEVGDRPLAYRLRAHMIDWLDEHIGQGHEGAIVVCSDLWYLNDDRLRRMATVSIGGPGVNALSAYLGDKIPAAFTIEDVLMVQVDLDFDDLSVCCWGMNHSATVSAVDAFTERYFDDFMAAATRGWAD